jgi:hypothetical protein
MVFAFFDLRRNKPSPSRSLKVTLILILLPTPPSSLVFVHGLAGDAISTWEQDGVVWPRDLLPVDLPHARVMTYGYRAAAFSFFSAAGHGSVFQIAQNLLQDLQRERRSAEEVSGILQLLLANSLFGYAALDRALARLVLLRRPF